MTGLRRIAVVLLPSLLFGLLLVAPAARANLLFDVNTTGDLPDAATGDHICDTRPLVAGDQCTLRAVIQESNMEPGADGIDFHIPGPGVKTIGPNTELPHITGPVEINGYTQGAASPNTKPLGQGDDAILRVELSGANTADQSNINGLILDAGATGSLIKGLVVNRFSGTGLILNADSTIQGNFIGTGPGGKVAHGMQFDGIFNNAHAQIGGTTAAARNLISGNGAAGPNLGSGISGAGTVTVQGNFIGTQRDGTSPLGNSRSGIRIFTSNNAVGGAAGAGNVIAFNQSDGISLYNTSMNIPISHNRIFSNADLGIDLGDDGRTPNDLGDGDSGPNELQNFPAITSATRTPGELAIDGRLRSTPNQSFTLEFFRNPSGGDEGKTFLDETIVSTDGTGLATFSFHPSRLAAAGDRITATATNANSSTSEFSAPRTVVSG